MTNRLVLIVNLWLKNGNVADFEVFERQASTIMARHGGKIERAIRLGNDDPETPFEVHLVSFPNPQAFAAYRADPAVAELAKMRQSVIARTVIWHGHDIAS